MYFVHVTPSLSPHIYAFLFSRVQKPLYPVVGLDCHWPVEFNFGRKAFAFDLPTFETYICNRIVSTCREPVEERWPHLHDRVGVFVFMCFLGSGVQKPKEQTHLTRVVRIVVFRQNCVLPHEGQRVQRNKPVYCVENTYEVRSR